MANSSDFKCKVCISLVESRRQLPFVFFQQLIYYVALITVETILHVIYCCDGEEKKLERGGEMCLHYQVFCNNFEHFHSDWKFRDFETNTYNAFIRVMKSRKARLAGHVARIMIVEVHTGILWENMTEGDNLEDTGLEGRIILK